MDSGPRQGSMSWGRAEVLAGSAEMAQNVRGDVHAGPGNFFPVVGKLGYGARVRMGRCYGDGSDRWCQIQAMDGRASGYVRERFLVKDGNTARKPDYWMVWGLPKGTKLNVRSNPAASAPALATLSEKEIVQNLGCRDGSNGRWCRIRSRTGIDVTGWVSARNLRESRRPIETEPPVRPPSTGDGDLQGPGD